MHELNCFYSKALTVLCWSRARLLKFAGIFLVSKCYSHFLTNPDQILANNILKLTEIYISDDYQNSYTYLPVVKYGCSNNQETWEMSWFGSKQDQVNIHTTIRVYYSKLEWINYSKLSGQIVQISKYTKHILPVRWHTTPPILSSIKSSPCGPQIYL